jgi:hypothetical protein
MPITWRNVNSQSNRAGVELLQGAERSINSGLGQFDSILQRERDNQQKNYSKQGQINEDEFLNQLQSYGTEKELAAAAPQLDALRRGYGGNIDQDAIRGAEDARVSAIRGQQTADQKFTDAQDLRSANPLLETISGLQAEGNTQGAAEEIAANEDLLKSIGQYDEVLTSNDSVAQDYKARTRRELKDKQTDAAFIRTETNRASQTNMQRLNTGLIESAVRDDLSFDQVRLQYLEQAVASPDIKREDVNDGLAKLQADYDTMFSLSKESKTEYASLEANLKVDTERSLRTSTRKLDQIKDDTDVPEMFRFTDETRLGFEDAVTTADGLGYDQDSLSSDIRAARDDFKAERVSNNEKFDSEDDLALDHLLNKVVEGLGPESTWLLDGDIPTGEIISRLKADWGKWKQAKSNRLLLKDAEKAFLTETAAAEDSARSQLSKRLTVLKGKVRGKSQEDSLRAIQSGAGDTP